MSWTPKINLFVWNNSAKPTATNIPSSLEPPALFHVGKGPETEIYYYQKTEKGSRLNKLNLSKALLVNINKKFDKNKQKTMLLSELPDAVMDEITRVTGSDPAAEATASERQSAPASDADDISDLGSVQSGGTAEDESPAVDANAAAVAAAANRLARERKEFEQQRTNAQGVPSVETERRREQDRLRALQEEDSQMEPNQPTQMARQQAVAFQQAEEAHRLQSSQSNFAAPNYKPTQFNLHKRASDQALQTRMHSSKPTTKESYYKVVEEIVTSLSKKTNSELTQCLTSANAIIKASSATPDPTESTSHMFNIEIQIGGHVEKIENKLNEKTGEVQVSITNPASDASVYAFIHSQKKFAPLTSDPSPNPNFDTLVRMREAAIENGFSLTIDKDTHEKLMQMDTQLAKHYKQINDMTPEQYRTYKDLNPGKKLGEPFQNIPEPSAGQEKDMRPRGSGLGGPE